MLNGWTDEVLSLEVKTGAQFAGRVTMTLKLMRVKERRETQGLERSRTGRQTKSCGQILRRDGTVLQDSCSISESGAMTPEAERMVLKVSAAQLRILLLLIFLKTQRHEKRCMSWTLIVLTDRLGATQPERYRGAVLF